jgi:excisionase family DNA binding protein
MQSAKSLTTKEVARLCQVSDATVKRWAEAGLLRSERTNGGHRRFRAEEIARFQREIGLGAKQSCGDESAVRAGFEERCKKIQPNSDLFRVLIEGREEETAAVLISSFLRGESLQQIFEIRFAKQCGTSVICGLRERFRLPMSIWQRARF